jgi:adenylosuccinate lyase
VRRVALPDGFFAFDGMLETTLHILDDMGVYEAVIARDLDRYLPFLATTTLLMEAVQRGAGREQAHTALREHALAAAIDMREQGRSTSELARRLGEDPRFPLSEEEITATISHSRRLTGAATQQVELFVGRVEELAAAHPEAHAIEKGRLL